MFSEICTYHPRNYPHNMWAIGYTIPSDAVPVVRVTEPWRVPFEVDNYVLHTPLDARPCPHSNHGGTVTMKMANPGPIRESYSATLEYPDSPFHPTSPLLQLKIYQPLYHFLRGSSTYDLKSVPASGRSFYTRLSNYCEIVERMRSNQHLIGGLRFEARLRCSFECVSHIWFKYKPYELDSFVSPARISMRSMCTSDFVDRAAEVLVVARQVAVRRGILYRTPNPDPSTSSEKDT